MSGCAVVSTVQNRPLNHGESTLLQYNPPLQGLPNPLHGNKKMYRSYLQPVAAAVRRGRGGGGWRVGTVCRVVCSTRRIGLLQCSKLSKKNLLQVTAGRAMGRGLRALMLFFLCFKQAFLLPARWTDIGRLAKQCPSTPVANPAVRCNPKTAGQTRKKGKVRYET